ncbi:acyl-CoA dehydrogenase family protein [Nocardia gipuzkoensis]
MSLAVDADQQALAESVAAFARKIAPLSRTRERLSDYTAGAMPAEVWNALCEQGLHALHLSASYGGDECGLATLAVAVEQLSTTLFPGPYLPTVTASALAMAATHAQPLMADFGAGMTGSVATGPDLRVTRDGDGWVVSGTSDPALGLPGAPTSGGARRRRRRSQVEPVVLVRPRRRGSFGLGDRRLFR